jgi:hypothetical protein
MFFPVKVPADGIQGLPQRFRRFLISCDLQVGTDQRGGLPVDLCSEVLTQGINGHQCCNAGDDGRNKQQQAGKVFPAVAEGHVQYPGKVYFIVGHL